MIESSAIATAWLAVNALLLLALALFLTGRYLMSSQRVHASFTQQRRFCEMVMLITLVAPALVLALSPLFSNPIIMPRLGLPAAVVSPLDDWPIIQALSTGSVSGEAETMSNAATPVVRPAWWQSLNPMGILFWVMVAGALVVVLRFLGSLWHLRNVVSDSVTLRKLGRVSILVSDRAAVPFSTVAFGRALVILPTSILSDARDTDIAIRHELQHHRQHDTWWALLIEVMRAVFFWNPAFYVLNRQLGRLQELSCDEELIRRRRCSADEYGGCLLRVARAATLRPRRLAVGIVAMTAGVNTASGLSGLLHMRVERLFYHGDSVSGRWLVRTLYLGVALLIMMVAQLAQDSRLYLKQQAASEPEAGAPVPLGAAAVPQTLPPRVDPAPGPASRTVDPVPGTDTKPSPQLQASTAPAIAAQRAAVQPETAVSVAQVNLDAPPLVVEDTPPAIPETRVEDIPALAKNLEETVAPVELQELPPARLAVERLAAPAQTALASAEERFAEAVTHYRAGDFESAKTLFIDLAVEGHHNAQFNLALMFYRGQGVERDLISAYAWVRLAARDGDSQKARVLEILRTMLGFRLAQKGDELAMELKPGVDLDEKADFNYSTEHNPAAVPAADEMRRDLRSMGGRTGSRLRRGLTPVGRVIIYDRHGMATHSNQLSRVPGS